MRGLIYVRQSLAKEGDQLAVERQEAECQRVAELRGVDVLRVIIDNNVSASRGHRPGYTELMQAIEGGEAEAVIVLRLDRLLRKLTELETLIELSERTGVQIITVQGDLDISNAQGRLLGRILASVARSEVETKSERHKLANRQRAAIGKPHGSRRPYGYQSDLMSLHDEEADVLREMARRVISGQGYKEVAHWLNRQGHTTTTGRPWLPITVRNLLRKPRYGGWRDYNGELFRGQWDPVFDAETYERLHLIIRTKSQRAGSTAKARKYLLTGLLFCGKCGLNLTGTNIVDRPGAPKRRIYMCRGVRDTGLVRGCGGVRRNADALDHYVRESVISYLDTPLLADLLKGDNAGELHELLEQRQTLQLRLDGLVEDYASGLLNREQLARAKRTVEASLQEAETAIDNASRRSVGANIPAGLSVREAWEKCDSDDWRRQLVGLVAKRIVVNPGKTKPYYMADGKRYRFDPTLVDIEWVG